MISAVIFSCKSEIYKVERQAKRMLRRPAIVLTAVVTLVNSGVVCTENLNANVVMVKSAQDRVRIDRSDPLNGTMDRRIFIQ